MKVTLRTITLGLALMALISAAMVANAWTVDDVIFSGTVGSGANTSYCVVDFGMASYAFKYNWGGTGQTGRTMLDAFKTNLPGFNFGAQPSGFVVNFAYDGHSITGDGSVAPDYFYWGYMTGVSTSTIAESYEGAGDRVLTNGSWDGWKWGGYPPTPLNVPGVPEPTSVMALGSLIGLAATSKLLRFRRK